MMIVRAFNSKTHLAEVMAIRKAVLRVRNHREDLEFGAKGAVDMDARTIVETKT